MKWRNTADFALLEYRRGLAAQKAGGQYFTPETMARLRTIAKTQDQAVLLDDIANGQFGSPDKVITFADLSPERKQIVENMAVLIPQAQATPMTMGAALDARTGILQLGRQMEKAGSTPSVGVLEQIRKHMTTDIQAQMRPDILPQWLHARATVSANKEAINSAYIKKLFLHENPEVPERVFAKIIETGKESDIARLMDLIGGNKDALANIRRAAADYV